MVFSYIFGGEKMAIKTKKKKLINVQPLRTKKDIQEIKLAIKRGNKGTPKNSRLAERDVLLFLVGINTGLRVGDIVQLKVGDVKGKDYFYILEGKTKKKRKVTISMLYDEIERFTEDKNLDDYLFKSQKGNGPITTTQVYRILEDAADFLGRNDIGTHTMRKTFGYHYYKESKDVAMLQEIFNHSAPSITKRYIGIRQDEIDDSLDGFRLG